MELIEQFENEWIFHDLTITPEIDEEFFEALEASDRGDRRDAASRQPSNQLPAER